MNFYLKLKTAQQKVIAYHSTNEKFNRFSLKNTAQNILWFATDKNTLINRQAGAQGSDIILTCQLTINKTADRDQYEKYGIWELKRDGFDSVYLQGDYIIFYPKNVKIPLKVQHCF